MANRFNCAEAHSTQTVELEGDALAIRGRANKNVRLFPNTNLMANAHEVSPLEHHPEGQIVVPWVRQPVPFVVGAVPSDQLVSQQGTNDFRYTAVSEGAAGVSSLSRLERKRALPESCDLYDQWKRHDFVVFLPHLNGDQDTEVLLRKVTQCVYIELDLQAERRRPSAPRCTPNNASARYHCFNSGIIIATAGIPQYTRIVARLRHFN
jgi:hypothetical protein